MGRFVLYLGMAVAIALAALPADAASKNKPAGRDVYTKEQQKKFFDEATRLCRKAYGPQLHYVKVDYRKGRPRYWCYHY